MFNIGNYSKSEEFEFTTKISPAKRLKILKEQQSYLYQICQLPVKKKTPNLGLLLQIWGFFD